MNLGDLLSTTAAGLPDAVATTAVDGEVTWSRDGRPFAVLRAGGEAVEFGLDGAVAAAATRTADVVLSGRGSGWVLFRPAALDDHGADRAAAWFASAHRRLAGG